jgi:acyl carrier protein
MGRLEEELKAFLVTTLDLEDVGAQDIEDETVLFGEGLGLDSVDALELGVAIQKQYGVKISAESEETHEHFTSVKTLAAFIRSSRGAQ